MHFGSKSIFGKRLFMFTIEETKKIGELARIELTEAELIKFSGELSSVLEYVEELKKVDTEGVEVLSTVTGLENVFRKDEIEKLITREVLFTNTPETKDGLVKVKAIL